MMRAPWIWILAAFPRTVSGPMPLRLRGQRLARPARVGAGFGMARVHRPLPGQRNLAEHGAVSPFTARARPENRELNIVRGPPLPVGSFPKLGGFIAARIHELEISAG